MEILIEMRFLIVENFLKSSSKRALGLFSVGRLLTFRFAPIGKDLPLDETLAN